MRVGTVIGSVTLGVRHPAFTGGRMLLVLPWKRETFQGKDTFDPGIAVYDDLGAGIGQRIAISEGREAACPFPQPTPVDAYCAALLDEIDFEPNQEKQES